MAAERRTLVLIAATICLLVTALTMVAPLLLDLSRELGVPLGEAGLLAASMSLPWALGAPFTGLLSDRVGRRPLIVLALVGMGLGCLASALVTSFAQLLLARFAAGVFGAFGPASVMAAVGDLFPPHKRSMAMSWLNAGFGLAAIGGVPLVGLVGGLFGWRWGFALAGLALVLLAGAVQLAFPAPPRPAVAEDLRTMYAAIVRVPRLGNVLVANLLERSIFNATTLYFPSLLMVHYALSTADVTPALTLVAIGTLGGNWLGGWLGDRCVQLQGKATVFVIAQLLAGAIGLALFSTAPGLGVSVMVGALFGLANASSRPAFLALGAELSPRYRGALLGVLSLTNQGGTVLGTAVGGLAIGLGSYPALAGLVASAGLGAAVCALPLARATLKLRQSQS